MDQKFTKELEKLHVNTAYLFGSQARGKTGPLSDYDIGILLEENTEISKYFNLKLKLMSCFGGFYKTGKIDLIILNSCPLILSMNIIKEGKIIYELDREYRIAFESQVMNRYLDRLYYEERYGKALLKQLVA